MQQDLHPELETLLEFFTRQRQAPPQPFVHAPGLIAAPSFYSVQALQAHLNNPLLSPEWVSVMLRGQAVDLDGTCLWKTAQTKKLQFMDKALLDEQLRRGAAVVLEGIDILDPDINAFVAGVDAALPCALAACVAFFSQRDNEAYGGHCDSDDVLVIQVAGEKRWSLFAPQQRRYLGNSPLTREQMGRPTAEIVMRAGDALLLRAGVPHQCRTQADHSLHLSFDLNDRTPNVEQITHEANTRYNHACAEPYAPAEAVIDRYVDLLRHPDFKRDLQAAQSQIKSNAALFRQRIARAAGVSALDRYARK